MAREMKDSGIEWIGEFPKEWTKLKIKQIGEYINGYAFKPEDWSNSGKPIIRIQNLTGFNNNFNYFEGKIDSKYLIKKNDILISWAATLDAFIWKGEEGWLNQHIFKAKPNEKLVCLSFFYWLMKIAMENMNNDNKHGIVMQHVTTKVFGNFSVVLPPLLEQEKIANYLDKKVADIDLIIEKTKATIEDYKKYKQSIITEAVTKGLNSNIEMKDSGIEWIGQIPKHWKIFPIKYILKWKSEKNHPNERVLSLYRDLGVIPKDSRDDNHNVTSEDTSSYKFVEKGDFVINKMKAWQGPMAVSEYQGIISPAYHICSFITDKINKKYFHHLLRNQLYLPEFRRLSTGLRIGQWDLGFEDFKNIPYLYPTIDEQQQIADYLDKKVSEIDNLISKKESLISEMEEYKKSLIYECVTGKKEITEGEL